VSITDILGKGKNAAAAGYFFRAGFWHDTREKGAVFHDHFRHNGYRRAESPGSKSFKMFSGLGVLDPLNGLHVLRKLEVKVWKINTSCWMKCPNKPFKLII